MIRLLEDCQAEPVEVGLARESAFDRLRLTTRWIKNDLNLTSFIRFYFLPCLTKETHFYFTGKREFVKLLLNLTNGLFLF